MMCLPSLPLASNPGLPCRPLAGCACADGDEDRQAPLEPAKKYKVAVKEYLATGKDGFDVFEASLLRY